jgi:hypothetical protein
MLRSCVRNHRHHQILRSVKITQKTYEEYEAIIIEMYENMKEQRQKAY